MTRPHAAVFLLLAALAGLACGEEDETADRFREGYNAAIERLNEVNANLEESGDGPTTESGGEIGREFDRIADAAAQTRSDLAELEPPEDARDEFDELLAAIREGVRSFRTAADAARERDLDGFRTAQEELSEDAEEISRADEELKDAMETD
jgi:hypothetical protein